MPIPLRIKAGNKGTSVPTRSPAFSLTQSPAALKPQVCCTNECPLFACVSHREHICVYCARHILGAAGGQGRKCLLDSCAGAVLCAQTSHPNLHKGPARCCCSQLTHMELMPWPILSPLLFCIPHSATHSPKTTRRFFPV